MHPGQPLLLLKQSHNAHNLLVDFRSEGFLPSFLTLAKTSKSRICALLVYVVLQSGCEINHTHDK